MAATAALGTAEAATKNGLPDHAYRGAADVADDRRFAVVLPRVNFSILDALARAENGEGVISKQQQLQAVCGVVT